MPSLYNCLSSFRTSVTKTDSAHNSTKNNRILVNSTTLENKVSLDKTTPQTNIIKSETPLAVCSGNLSKSAVQKPVAQSSVKKRGHSESDAEKKVENPGGKIMKTETEKRVKPNITSIGEIYNMNNVLYIWIIKKSTFF